MTGLVHRIWARIAADYHGLPANLATLVRSAVSALRSSPISVTGGESTAGAAALAPVRKEVGEPHGAPLRSVAVGVGMNTTSRKASP